MSIDANLDLNSLHFICSDYVHTQTMSLMESMRLSVAWFLRVNHEADISVAFTAYKINMSIYTLFAAWKSASFFFFLRATWKNEIKLGQLSLALINVPFYTVTLNIMCKIWYSFDAFRKHIFKVVPYISFISYVGQRQQVLKILRQVGLRILFWHHGEKIYLGPSLRILKNVTLLLQQWGNRLSWVQILPFSTVLGTCVIISKIFYYKSCILRRGGLVYWKYNPSFSYNHCMPISE